MKFISLFAGIGGFDLALERLGHTCVYANDIDKYCKIIYDKNFKMGKNKQTSFCIPIRQKEIYGTRTYIPFPKRHNGQSNISSYSKTYNYKKYGLDNRSITEVTTDEIPEHDLLVGGFPCQSFSIAGKRGGFNDTRGTLFFEIARIVREHRPMYLLLENVKGLVSHDSGKTIETILLTLQEFGYYVNIEVCNSKDYGVPQNRERIFFLCRKINVLESVGQNQKMTSCEQTIQEWLFQLLLNNLKEAEKRQETESKDSILASLILKEINQNLKSKDESISVGILTDTEEKCYQSTEKKWQSIDLLLKEIWEENYLGKNKYTISTAIKQITDWKTFTYFQMLLSILTATVHLRNSSKNLWNKILLNLTLIKENTNYARINDKTEKIIITEDGVAHLSSNFQDIEKNFIIGHLRGTPRPEVFPIGEDDNPLITKGGEQTSDAVVSRTLTATDAKMHLDGNYIKQLNKPKHSNNRVYGADGISPTLNTMQGGNRQPKVGIDIANCLTPDAYLATGDRKRINGKAVLTSMCERRIRRLTPIECERLQGFPDGWTEGVSDTQRYKMCGNAVTVNVICEIAKYLVV